MAVMKIEYYSEVLDMEWGGKCSLPRCVSGNRARLYRYPSSLSPSRDVREPQQLAQTDQCRALATTNQSNCRPAKYK